MDKEVNNNGYEYVDLGLPSGTLWATMNVGASKPSDAGQYFQWGDTQGYTSSQVGTGEGQKKFALDWRDCKWYDSDKKTFTKYTIYGEMLELKDDAAHVHMGGDWHIPTPTQLQELLRNTTNTWTTQDGVNGRLFTSKSDPSKSIFIPAAGSAIDGSVSLIGSYGYVWSSMLSTGYVDYGQFLIFYSGDAGLNYNGRNYGFSVRGVIDKKFDKPKEKKNDMEYTKCELRNLDITIAKFVLPRLKEFRKVANGYPNSLETFEDWEKIIDKMIQSFELVLDDNDPDFDVKASYVVKDGKKVIKDESSTDEAKEYIDYFTEKDNKIQEGLDLFSKYFQELWI